MLSAACLARLVRRGDGSTKGAQSSPVPQLAKQVNTNPVTLDIASPDEDKCSSFYYSFTSSAVRLIVPKKGVALAKILKGSETVWTLSICPRSCLFLGSPTFFFPLF